MQIVIMMPVYEDWDSAIELCRKIDSVFQKERSDRVSLLLIDDGSAANTYPSQPPFQLQVIERISILKLTRNLGHQRAIAIGLAYAQQHSKADAVVIMDADGEDKPEDIPRLIAAMRDVAPPTAVFAERGRRLENWMFQLSYRCYSLLHRIFTGRDTRFGNFSVLPWSHVDTLVTFPELWNHYSTTLLKSRLAYLRVRCDRSPRLFGKSHMNVVSLVVHGLSAVFANQEVVGTRLLLMALVVTLALALLAAVEVGIKLFTDLALPAWVALGLVLLIMLVGQFLVACFILVFFIMMNRSHLGFLPVRDYPYFVRDEVAWYPQ